MTFRPDPGSSSPAQPLPSERPAPPRRRAFLRIAPAACLLWLSGYAAASAAGRTSAEASYLRGVSQKFYAVWVQTVLSRSERELGPTDPFNQPGRQVVLRLRFSPRGVIRSARVLRSSGYRPFDTTAQSTVLGIFGYPTPPASLRSDDGDIYLDWTFKRSRPWCHESLARVVRVPFTVSILASGHYDRAVRMLAAAARKGQFRRFARDFGRQLLRLAARTQRSRVARDLIQFLDRPVPIEVLRTVFRSAELLSLSQLRTASLRLAAQPGAAPQKLLAALVTMTLPGKPRRAALYLDALAHRPSAARYTWPRLRVALLSPSPLLSAPAARILSLAGSPAERAQGRAHLLALLRAHNPQSRLAALHQIRPPLALAGDLLDGVRRLTRYPLPSLRVRAHIARLLARYPTPEARRTLLILTYTRTTALGIAALHSLLEIGAGPAGCYRALSLVKHRKSSAKIRQAAAAVLARHCMSILYGPVRRLVRRGPTSVRLGIATQIPLALPRAKRLVARLARDPSSRVRKALLVRLRARAAIHSPRLLRRWQRHHPKDFQALRCHAPIPPSALLPCLSRALRPEAALRIALRIAHHAPAAVAPWTLRLLHAKDWPSRLRAARVLLVVSPAPH